jgi:hypothetical protein
MGYDKMYISNDQFLVDGAKDDISRTEQVKESSIGRKFDGNKLEYGLLPPFALEAAVDVLTFGAQKYERDNWKRVPDSERRYFDALERHVWAWKKGEQLDPESGKHHLAHAMCCLMFLLEKDLFTDEEWQTHIK